MKEEPTDDKKSSKLVWDETTKEIIHRQYGKSVGIRPFAVLKYLLDNCEDAKEFINAFLSERDEFCDLQDELCKMLYLNGHVSEETRSQLIKRFEIEHPNYPKNFDYYCY